MLEALDKDERLIFEDWAVKAGFFCDYQLRPITIGQLVYTSAHTRAAWGGWVARGMAARGERPCTV